MAVSKKEISPCPIDSMLSVIDGRWKGTILWRLLDGPMRTSELRRSIPEITERMLILHLHEMAEDGIIFEARQKKCPAARLLVDFAIWHDARAGAREDL